MDWTGGVRKRYVNRGKSDTVLQKQKAHFAKQRAKAQQAALQPRLLPRVREAEFHHAGSLTKVPAMECKNIQSIRGPPDSQTWQQRALSDAHHSPVIHECSSPLSIIHRPSIHDRARPSYGTRDRYSAVLNPVQDHTPGAGHSLSEGNLFSHRRRQLLARNDWLNLSILKPIRVEFPRDHSIERICRRRKVARQTDHPQRSIRRRQIAPISNKLQEFNEYLMSGALPEEHVEVRIGTQAFASQTQPAPQSSANTSMRAPSTSLGSISEESMLLGEEDILFESQALKPTLPERIPCADMRSPGRIFRESFEIGHDRNPVFPVQTRPDPVDGLTALQPNAAVQGEKRQNLAVRSSSSDRSYGDEESSFTSRRPQDGVTTVRRRQRSNRQESPSRNRTVRSRTSHHSRTAEGPYELLRNNISEVQLPALTTASIIALESSDPYEASQKSTSSRQSSTSDSVRFREGTHGEKLSSLYRSQPTAVQAPIGQNVFCDSRVGSESQPLLGVVVEHAETPEAASIRQHEYVDDGHDLAWRAFMIGDKSSISTSSPIRTPRLIRRGCPQISPVQHISSYTDEMRSDQATTGGSYYGTQTKPTSNRQQEQPELMSASSFQQLGNASMDVGLGLSSTERSFSTGV